MVAKVLGIRARKALHSVAVASAGKSERGQHRLRTTSILIAAAFGAVAGVAAANPQGAKVVNGSATITNNGSTLVIKNSPGAIINWQSFSIGRGETTNFIQQSVNSAVLNRVTGVDPSVILGNLTSNGKVFLVNPNGVVFGSGAMVDAAGLVVSSLNITDQDFKNGTLRFVGSGTPGDISVAGVLRSNDGDVYLIAPNVTNSGSITAVNGNVTLAAGQDVQILGAGLTDIQFNVQNKGNSAVNLGTINGNAVGIFAGSINQGGVVNANTATVVGGKVILSALGDTTLSAGSVTSADNAQGAAGSVLVQSLGGNVTVAQGASVSASGQSGGSVTLLANNGNTSVTGTIAATGSLGLGGPIDVLGQNVALNSGALIDASGYGGGGTILVGGQHNNTGVMQATATSVAAGVLVNADATGTGNGGNVSLYGTNTLAFAGSIQARGGVQGGNGGLVETSGDVIDIVGSVAAGARAPGGKAGTWLLDPINVTVGNGTGYSVSPTNTTVSSAAIANALDLGTSVDIETSSAATNNSGASITVVTGITAAAVIDNATLTLGAQGGIDIEAPITGIAGLPSNGGTPLSIFLNSDSLPGAGSSGILLNAAIYIPGGSLATSGQSFTSTAAGSIRATNVNITSTGTGTGISIGGAIDASADSNGGVNGGQINLTSYNGDISVEANLNANAAVASTGYGGSMFFWANGNNITIAGASASAPITLSADGGSLNTGGAGGSINITPIDGDQGTAGNITISNATLSVAGGNTTGANGLAGNGGTISITGLGTVALTNVTALAYGGENLEQYSTGASGGTINITGTEHNVTGGLGGSGDDATSSGAGGTGGTINLYGEDLLSITDSTLLAGGGVGGSVFAVNTYNGIGAGGSGGTIFLQGYNGVTLTGVTADASGGTAGPGGDGGQGGTINVSSLGLITVNGGFITANGGSASAALLASSTAAPLSDGGSGGSAGSIDFDGQSLAFSGVMIDAIGGVAGAGGAGFDTPGSVVYAPSSSGAGGAGGMISFETVDYNGSGTLSMTGSTVDVSGGDGAAGGSYNGRYVAQNLTAGYGGDGGAAGSISLNASGALTLSSTTLLGAGGSGGAGGSLTGTDRLAVGGTGGAGGEGAVISIATFIGENGSSGNSDITFINATVASIGGAGGDGGQAGLYGGGGSGGNGGSTPIATSGPNPPDDFTPFFSTLSQTAISISAQGSISFDATTVIKTIGGNGGNGQSATGYDPAGTYAIGPGNGGNGGTAGTIFVISQQDNSSTGIDTISNAGTFMVIGGNGGNGGSILGSNLTTGPSYTTLVAGSGGTGGDAGSPVNGYNNGAINIDADNGSYISSASSVITVTGGNGGNGGSTADNTFGPGNGGNGGTAQTTFLYAQQGGMTINGTITLTSGAGGNGGNAPAGGMNLGGSGGNSGDLGAYGEGALNLDSGDNALPLYLGATIVGNVGNEGQGGANGGYYGFLGTSYPVYLYTGGADILQTAGSIGSNNYNVGLSLNATGSNISLTAAGNQISYISGFANGNFDVTSSVSLAVDNPNTDGNDSTGISADGEVTLIAPYLQIAGAGVAADGAVTLNSTQADLDIESQVSAGGAINISSANNIYVDAQVVSFGGPANLTGQFVNVSNNVTGYGINVIAGGGLSLFGSLVDISGPDAAGIDLQLLSLYVGEGSVISTEGAVTVQSVYGGTVYLTPDSYASGYVPGSGSGVLALGSEFFTAVTAAAINVGQYGANLNLTSYSGTGGYISLNADTTLGLTGAQVYATSPNVGIRLRQRRAAGRRAAYRCTDQHASWLWNVADLGRRVGRNCPQSGRRGRHCGLESDQRRRPQHHLSRYGHHRCSESERCDQRGGTGRFHQYRRRRNADLANLRRWHQPGRWRAIGNECNRETDRYGRRLDHRPGWLYHQRHSDQPDCSLDRYCRCACRHQHLWRAWRQCERRQHLSQRSHQLALHGIRPGHYRHRRYRVHRHRH